MEVEVRKVDSQGRVSLPVKWRKRELGDTDEVYVIDRGQVLLVKPKCEPDLTKYFNSVKVDVEPEAFEDYHELRKALLRGG